MIITNAVDYTQHVSEDHFYFFAIGYEHRSFYLYDKLKERFSGLNAVFFVLDDYQNYADTATKVKEIREKGLPIHIENYHDSHNVHKTILEYVQQYIGQRDSITVHIDYSSMPRSWYAKLPSLLKPVMRDTDRSFFWYVEGEYPASHEEYPSSGIDSFSFFSGKPSLQVDNNRIHIVGLGYDVIRTQAILSITDPSYLVACYAYNPEREDFLGNLRQLNDPILARSAMALALHLKDFEFMVSKLCDTANELLPIGDIILIPDGPKPLIFAMSLVPELINKHGITCLHISRNKDYFEAVDVLPTGIVYGFEIQPQKSSQGAVAPPNDQDICMLPIADSAL